MRLLRRVVVGVGAVIGVLVLLLVGSVVVDAAVGGGRVDAVANARIPGSTGTEVRAFVARPATPGPHPAVLMIHEWWGLNESIAQKAQALADEGYVVVAPDLFRGSSTGWIPRAIYQVSTSDAAQVDADLQAVFDWLATQPDVLPDRIAVMGFCFGGGTALRYSLSNPELAATAIFYGSPILEPERLRALPGPVLGIFGEDDAQIPVSEVLAFEQALAAAGARGSITIYPGQPHAFIESVDEIRRPGPEQDAWNELLRFLGESLGEAGAPAPIARPAGRADDVAAAFGPQRVMHLLVCDLAVRGRA